MSKPLGVFWLMMLTCVICASAAPTPSQQPNCLPPVALPAPTEPNIFIGEKEIWLGDAAAERIQKDYRLIEDASLNEYLARVGERLVKYLPLNDLKFRFVLVDLGDANAFVLPGGRIYVSRKLVAAAQSEDELAGVIAHELGHLVTHEAAVDFTGYFRDVLGVTQVTDRKDVFEKYNQLIDNVFVKAGKIKRRDRESGQMAADQAGFYALVNAGYDPSAQARFWDRMVETQGKTGSWFSDLFGNTRPEEKRLRDMVKNVNALPASCRENRTPQMQADFTAWQSRVVAHTATGRAAALHNVVAQTQLKPALRSDVSWLRYSPNGKLILAEDDSGITVLAREPFATRFRIPVDDAYEAEFSPDSQSVIFSTSNLRVERWSVADQKLSEAHELTVYRGCIQTELSPDGRTFACLGNDLSLQLIDVATGRVSVQKKEFFKPDWYQSMEIYLAQLTAEAHDGDLNVHMINMHFSPDGRYFAAGYFGQGRYGGYFRKWGDQVEVIDTTTLASLSVGDKIRRLIAGGFAFMGNDRLVGVDHQEIKKSGIVTFPEGKPIATLTLWRYGIFPATKDDYLMIRPIKDHALGVMDVKTGEFTKVSAQAALDIYGDEFVSEMRNGQLGIYRWDQPEPVASVLLPDSNLGRLWVAEVSPDVKWVSLSGRSRGGVWSLTNGSSNLSLRGFRGAHFEAGGTFYADFPKFETAERNVAKFNLASGEVTPGLTIEAGNTRQVGPYLALVRPAKEKKKKDDDETEDEDQYIYYERDVVLEIKDVRSQKLLWSQAYPDEAPRLWIDSRYGTAALVWNLQSDHAQSMIKADARLSAQLAAMKDKAGDYFVQIVEAATGKERGRLMIETGKGSFRLKHIAAAGDRVVVTDSQNRVLLYSLGTGVQTGRVFGGYATISTVTDLLCVENESGKLAVYDLKTMERRDEFIFAGPVSLVSFTPNGKRLLVVTSDQNVYLLAIAAEAFAAAH